MLRIKWCRRILGWQSKDGRHGVEWSSADGEKRLDSKNTLRIELNGFGDRYEVKSEREEYSMTTRFWPDNCHYRLPIY